MRFKCNLCDYKARWNHSLKALMLALHENMSKRSLKPKLLSKTVQLEEDADWIVQTSKQAPKYLGVGWG